MKTDLERRRPRIGALLASAHVLEIDGTKLVLGFEDRTDVDAAERVRGEIELALSTEMGTAVRLVTKQDKGAHVAPLIRAETLEEADALSADKYKREQEARQHPIIQKSPGPVRGGHPGDQDLMDGEPRGLRDLIQTAQKIQAEVARIKDELSSKTAEGESGGGLVRCVVSGTGEVLELNIDPSLTTLSRDCPAGCRRRCPRVASAKMLEDLVVGAVNVALARAKELAKQEMAQVTGGLPMPPGMFGA